MRWVGGAAGQRGSGAARPWSRCFQVTPLLALLLGSRATAHQEAAPPPRSPAIRLEPASPPRRAAAPPALTVYLMTMGPGKQVWERFGHNAIWIHDPVRGTDKAYNYGLFDFHQQKFLLRFIQGRMWYWMQGFPAQSYVELYRRANRSVWVQELEVPPDAGRELQAFLEWNERPENRFYHYDYYRDNCSTRVRDALDRTLHGRIRALTAGLATSRTYRFHTRRLTENDPPIYTGLLLALGQPVDRPISAWQEMFLPLALRDHLRRVTVVGADGAEMPLVRSERILFQSTGIAPPDKPPFWLPIYLGLGLVIGAAAVGLGGSARTSRHSRRILSVLVVGWALVIGTAGLILAGLWALTDHAAAYYNENLLQCNLLALPLIGLVPKAIRRPGRESRTALFLAGLIAGASVLGLFLKLSPQFYQVNGEIIAFALPAHLGVLVAIWRLTRG